jgi:hypothetical protein
VIYYYDEHKMEMSKRPSEERRKIEIKKSGRHTVPLGSRTTWYLGNEKDTAIQYGGSADVKVRLS